MPAEFPAEGGTRFVVILPSGIPSESAPANGTVYVEFGGREGDCGTYYGYVVGVWTPLVISMSHRPWQQHQL